MTVEVQPLAGQRQSGESAKAIQALNDYLRMGPGRSLSGLHKKYADTNQNQPPTQSLATLKGWSTRYDWQERASIHDAQAEQRKNAERKAVVEEGLALDYERVTELKRLANFLLEQMYEQGEDGVYHNIWVSDVKQIGGGEFAERVDIERFNAAIIEQFRGTLDDLAKETGGRKQQVDHIVKHLDYSRLTDEQLDRIIDGEDPVKVILSGYVSTSDSES